MQTCPSLSRSLRFTAVLMMVAAAPAHAAVYAVGTEPGCTHATIQAAVDAAEANPGEDFIRIPHSQVWNEQAIVINTAQTLWLEGYWSDCNTIDGSTHTTLDGFGGSAAPVIRINAPTGSVIGLDMLTIRNGDVSGTGGKGGGIYYRGNGTLSLSNSAIINNTAGLGGGMYLEGTGDAAAVYIQGGVGITGNVALDSGGGVFAEAVNLYVVQPNSVIAFNEAIGYELLGVTVGGFGGGLVVNNTTSLDGQATIGSAGIGNAGAIHGNSARYGGGVAVLGEDGETYSRLFLHATAEGVPAKVDQNFAGEGGGGLYLANEFANAYVWNATIEGNAASQGSAAFLEDWGGLFVQFSAPAGAVPCPSNAACTHIAGNVDQDALGQPTGGAVIHAEDGAYGLYFGCSYDGVPPGARGIVLEGNRGGHLINATSNEFFHACSMLMTGNEVSGTLIHAADWGLALLDSTIVGNIIGGSSVLDIEDDAELQRVLIWQPGTPSLSGDSAPMVQWTIASEAVSLGGGPGAITVPSPRFVDPERGDYRLRAASPAIDYAPPIAGDDRDVYGQPRDQGMPAVPRPVPERVRDVGAFERQSLLPMLLNGDFVGDTNLWLLPAGHAGNFQVNNAPGSTPGSGSAQVAGPGGGDRLLGYVQCIHLPGPGTYALNGWARTEGDPQLGNPTGLIWELRLDGGEGCIDGPIARGGTLSFPTQVTLDTWTPAAGPALVTVSESEWNHNSSLTVIMAVYPNASGSSYNGLFDGITLEWSADGSDVIFADGFDGQ